MTSTKGNADLLSLWWVLGPFRCHLLLGPVVCSSKSHDGQRSSQIHTLAVCHTGRWRGCWANVCVRPCLQAGGEWNHKAVYQAHRKWVLLSEDVSHHHILLLGSSFRWDSVHTMYSKQLMQARCLFCCVHISVFVVCSCPMLWLQSRDHLWVRLFGWPLRKVFFKSLWTVLLVAPTHAQESHHQCPQTMNVSSRCVLQALQNLLQPWVSFFGGKRDQNAYASQCRVSTDRLFFCEALLIMHTIRKKNNQNMKFEAFSASVSCEWFSATSVSYTCRVFVFVVLWESQGKWQRSVIWGVFPLCFSLTFSHQHTLLHAYTHKKTRLTCKRCYTNTTGCCRVYVWGVKVHAYLQLLSDSQSWLSLNAGPKRCCDTFNLLNTE